MLPESKYQIWQNVKLTNKMETWSAVSTEGQGFACMEPPAAVSSMVHDRRATLQSLEIELGRNNKPKIYKSIGNQMLFCFNT